MAVEIRIERSRLVRFLGSPRGIVGIDLRRRARRVEAAARRRAPGSMKDGIVSGLRGSGKNLHAYVASTHPASEFVINGTRPHQIRPVRAKALRFRVGGRIVYAKLVRHPGTKPNDFLNKALREAVR